MSAADRTSFILGLLVMAANLGLAALLFVYAAHWSSFAVALSNIIFAGLLTWRAVRIWRRSRASRQP